MIATALQNCKGCGKLMGETPSGYCDICKTSESSYSNLHRVKDYLYDNPNTIITVVSKDTGVSVAEISKFVRDGSIREVSGVSVIQGGKCSCGCALEGNERLCKDCKRENNHASERVKKELSKKIPTPAVSPPTGTGKVEFFTRHK